MGGPEWRRTVERPIDKTHVAAAFEPSGAVDPSRYSMSRRCDAQPIIVGSPVCVVAYRGHLIGCPVLVLPVGDVRQRADNRALDIEPLHLAGPPVS
jgi:hypothetical protein